MVVDQLRDPGFIILAIVGLIAALVVLYRLKQVPGTTWVSVLTRAPLPMLAAASSYGVYSFSSIFMPPWMALLSSMAFELVYISLSYTILTTEKMKVDAQRVAIGAVIVAIIYNVIAGYLHLRPLLMSTLTDGVVFILAIIHGAPLATVAYLYAQLMFHQNHGEYPQEGGDIIEGKVKAVPTSSRVALPSTSEMEEARLKILEMKEKGMTPRQVAEQLGGTWTPQKVRKVLRDALQ